MSLSQHSLSKTQQSLGPSFGTNLSQYSIIDQSRVSNIIMVIRVQIRITLSVCICQSKSKLKVCFTR